MKITQAEVLHVAELARLDMDATAIETMAAQLGEILEYVDLLNRADTRGVSPTTHAISIENAFRDDVPAESLDPDVATGNAPEKEQGHFLVPKVIG